MDFVFGLLTGIAIYFVLVIVLALIFYIKKKRDLKKEYEEQILKEKSIDINESNEKKE